MIIVYTEFYPNHPPDFRVGNARVRELSTDHYRFETETRCEECGRHEYEHWHSLDSALLHVIGRANLHLVED